MIDMNLQKTEIVANLQKTEIVNLSQQLLVSAPTTRL